MAEQADIIYTGRVETTIMDENGNRTLIPDPQYQGKYVALISCNDNTVVGFGKSREKARKKAKQKGCDTPFVLYVPAGHGACCINAHR